MKRTPMPARTKPMSRGAPMRKRARKTTAARQAAKGRPCLVRLPGCDGGGETTVLAHYRLAGYSGIGMKPSDLLAAHACASCHDICDGRKPLAGWSREEIRLAHAEACLRTAALLESEAA